MVGLVAAALRGSRTSRFILDAAVHISINGASLAAVSRREPPGSAGGEKPIGGAGSAVSLESPAMRLDPFSRRQAVIGNPVGPRRLAGGAPDSVCRIIRYGLATLR